jgi:hypothetical protein
MLQIDLAIYNKSHQLILTVEIKTKLGVSAEWASQLRRNILAHGNYPLAPYFLLATPDSFFLWVKKNNNLKATSPDYVLDATEILKPYFQEFSANPREVSGFIFEQIVLRWLKSIMYPEFRDANMSMPAWLDGSGLSKAVLHGDFSIEQAA